MNSLLNKLSAITIFFFIVGILLSAYFIIRLPDDLEAQTTLITLVEIKEFMPVINERLVLIGLSMTFGLISIILLLAGRKAAAQRVVYVESFVDNKREATVDQIMEQDDQDTNTLEKLRDIITNIVQESEEKAFEKLLSKVCNMVGAVQGAYYKTEIKQNLHILKLAAGYAFTLRESESLTYEFGEGLAGQVAKEKRLINISNVPEGYITILSGLGSSSPNHLIISPILLDEEVYGVVEIASFTALKAEHENIIRETFKALAEKYKS